MSTDAAYNALELIACPMRPDGTWNRDREACRQLAADALASTPARKDLDYLHQDGVAAWLDAQHPDDAAVDRFAQALKLKLKAARENGRSGWQTCPPADLSRMLREHVEKGDPRDVANFCMFLWALGAGIDEDETRKRAAPQRAEPPPTATVAYEAEHRDGRLTLHFAAEYATCCRDTVIADRALVYERAPQPPAEPTGVHG